MMIIIIIMINSSQYDDTRWTTSTLNSLNVARITNAVQCHSFNCRITMIVMNSGSQLSVKRQQFHKPCRVFVITLSWFHRFQWFRIALWGFSLNLPNSAFQHPKIFPCCCLIVPHRWHLSTWCFRPYKPYIFCENMNIWTVLLYFTFLISLDWIMIFASVTTDVESLDHLL